MHADQSVGLAQSDPDKVERIDGQIAEIKRLLREAERASNGSLIVHNYGHSGAGVTLSWGCAEEAVSLLATAWANVRTLARVMSDAMVLPMLAEARSTADPPQVALESMAELASGYSVEARKGKGWGYHDPVVWQRYLDTVYDDDWLSRMKDRHLARTANNARTVNNLINSSMEQTA